MTNKERYAALCEQYDMPIFMQYWWLEAVSAGKDWDVIIVYEGGDAEKEVLAAMPYEYSSLFTLRAVTQQEMTPYGGIWLNPAIEKEGQRVSVVLDELCGQMKTLKIWRYYQRFGVSSNVPKYLERMNFKTVTRYTYAVDDLTNLDEVLSRFSENKRKKLSKLTADYQIKTVDPEAFYRFYVATSAQKNLRLAYTREMFWVLWEKCRDNQHGEVVGVYSADDELLAAAFLVWDNQTMYQLVDTFDHDHPDNGAREMLTFDVLQRAHDKQVKLDFTNHRDYLKHYGAKRHRYASVYQGSLTHTWLRRAVEWFYLQVAK